MSAPERPEGDGWDDPEVEEATGDRGAQPGYDLDEGELYEEQDPDAPEEG